MAQKSYLLCQHNRRVHNSNCMAGLGETCTHISAVLFYLEAVAHLQGTKSVTVEWVQLDYTLLFKISTLSAYQEN